MRQLLAAERGALLVVGTFFAVLAVALLIFAIDVARLVLFRERLQNAADAVAFSVAAAHARGMNLLALINLAMAAMLALLVALRLGVTLCSLAIGVCIALAVPTAGASLAPVEPLGAVTKELAVLANQLEKVLPRALAVLHTAGKAASVAVPLGANSIVAAEVARAHEVDGFGVTLPARLTLPVDDLPFPILCEHAGQLAGAFAVMPLSPILPGRVERRLERAVGKLAAAGPSWFCGGAGEKPVALAASRTIENELPDLAAGASCERAALAFEPERGEKSLAGCGLAAVEALASLPDRRGRCRAGEPLCPERCEPEGDDPRCPSSLFKPCEAEEARTLANLARAELGAAAVSCGAASPFERRRTAARTQCARAGLHGYSWSERPRAVTYEYAAPLGFRAVLDDAGPSELVARAPNDARLPCSVGAWNADPAQPLCERDVRCEGSALLDARTGRCEPPARPVAGMRYTRRFVEVLDVFGCIEHKRISAASQAPFDLEDALTRNGKGENKSGFAPEPEAWLGSEEYAVRSFLGMKEVPGSLAMVKKALEVEDSELGLEAELNERLGRRLGRVGLAQAEYYFDGGLVGAESLDQLGDPRKATEWLWHMGWQARLRPLRLPAIPTGSALAAHGADGEQLRLLPATAPARRPCGGVAASFSALCSEAFAQLSERDRRGREAP